MVIPGNPVQVTLCATKERRDLKALVSERKAQSEAVCSECRQVAERECEGCEAVSAAECACLCLMVQSAMGLKSDAHFTCEIRLSAAFSFRAWRCVECCGFVARDELVRLGHLLGLFCWKRRADCCRY